MLLREFLYVDSDKVRGLLAQLDEGVVEGTTETSQSEKSSAAGLKGFAEHSQRWGSATAIQKSQGDALFPTLESALEALGLLTDLSERLQDPDAWGSLAEDCPPGSLVRITAAGALFDARYLASTFAAFATTAQGLRNINAVPAPAPVPPTKGGKQAPRNPAAKKQQTPDGPVEIEDAIRGTTIDFGDGEPMDAQYLRGIVQVARALFTPGLHMNLRPAGDADFSVTARLQEGRQFLDGEPEVLFSRYGVSHQEWTLVGSIGWYGPASEEPYAVEGDIMNADGETVNRSKFADMVNTAVLELGRIGFIDTPQPPGFSVVPLAVYRVIGSPDSIEGSQPAHLERSP